MFKLPILVCYLLFTLRSISVGGWRGIGKWARGVEEREFPEKRFETSLFIFPIDLPLACGSRTVEGRLTCVPRQSKKWGSLSRFGVYPLRSIGNVSMRPSSEMDSEKYSSSISRLSSKRSCISCC